MVGNRPANMGARFVAALIDVILLGVLFVVMAKVAGSSSASGSSVSLALNGGPALLYFVLVLVYFVASEALLGGTIGKLVLGMRVIGADGANPSWGAATIRNLLRIIDGLPFLYLVGFVLCITSSNRQRLGDRAACAMVVRKS